MFSLCITMCNKSAMCKLPENSTILGYGLSYESDLPEDFELSADVTRLSSAVIPSLKDIG